ncbi:(2Fe-2S)-binding protein [Pseudoxanthomonas composti]|uniref:Bacterioferritin-associated ferredoxin n=1 Tax=Pseudoxanthomonas composti TaxID=2137479 RepID=A0A4Q1JVC2_9GAMM|nr:(2Fe-2S)-binding protein [Pseudoxanthomonas composti]RXR03537.1 bacterioferritin [Pseudoxanthomonas composti]
MYVCICNGVTDHQIRQAAEEGCRTTSELTMRTGCGATCGSCLEMAGDILASVHAFPLAVLPGPLAEAA